MVLEEAIQTLDQIIKDAHHEVTCSSVVEYRVGFQLLACPVFNMAEYLLQIIKDAHHEVACSSVVEYRVGFQLLACPVFNMAEYLLQCLALLNRTNSLRTSDQIPEKNCLKPSAQRIIRGSKARK